MGGRDSRHPRRRTRAIALWLPVVLVLAILAAAATAYLLDADGEDRPDDPAAIAPPPGLELPAATTPEPVAGPAAGTADPAKVRRAVAGVLEDADLGHHVRAAVSAPDGTLLYTSGTGEAMPASTLKLLTTTAALGLLGPDHVFDTTVVAVGAHRVVLVGGGDPLLSRRDLRGLARETAAALRTRGAPKQVQVGYDTSLFSGPDVSPHWPETYVPEGVVSPIQALWVDEGRPASGFGRVADPAAAAAQEYAAQLARAGVTVTGSPREQTAPDTANELASVSSQPLGLIVEHTISTSDNEAAEVLARQVGLAATGHGTFAAGAKAVLATVSDLGVPLHGARVYDGSGLSREDRIDPETLTAVLESAGGDAHPELRAVLTGLPVAGFTGSLAYRFDTAPEGRGFVRAKTGTLSGVSGLAGTVTSRDGVPMVFAFLADRIDLVDTLGARAALDDATSALAGCRCGVAGTVAP